jgi:hypothetical protein
MVHSRSETNLNRIFIDLCTSPQIRSKHGHQPNNQRQYHPPLPILKSIKSNSCSNINELEQTCTESLSCDSDHTEQRDTLDLPSLPPSPLVRTDSIGSSGSASIPLVPMASTGFTVQTASPLVNRSVPLFGTLSINHPKKPSPSEETSKDNTKTKLSSSPPNSSALSQDWKQQDFTNRLQNRLRSRGHLRKFFLS